ncbi:MAG: hypothetical protein KGD63_04330 [Candidatus Lokiarchaeota archaeon]|nr:hypothetical protein [Candidatus Lokiarchaeota archaeon]
MIKIALDIYIGSFTRYYSKNWLNNAQKLAKEQGIPYNIVTPTKSENTITDPDKIHTIMVIWREKLSKGLGSSLKYQLDWSIFSFSF